MVALSTDLGLDVTTFRGDYMHQPNLTCKTETEIEMHSLHI